MSTLGIPGLTPTGLPPQFGPVPLAPGVAPATAPGSLDPYAAAALGMQPQAMPGMQPGMPTGLPAGVDPYAALYGAQQPQPQEPAPARTGRWKSWKVAKSAAPAQPQTLPMLDPGLMAPGTTLPGASPLASRGIPQINATNQTGVAPDGGTLNQDVTNNNEYHNNHYNWGGNQASPYASHPSWTFSNSGTMPAYAAPISYGYPPYGYNPAYNGYYGYNDGGILGSIKRFFGIYT